MNISVARYALASLLVFVAAVPANADNIFKSAQTAFVVPSFNLAPASSSRLVFKLGTYFLGDDAAEKNFGIGPKIAAGFEYPLERLDLGSHVAASAYVDLSNNSGSGGGASLYSTGIVERLSILHGIRRSVPYIGVGIGANFNAFDLRGQGRFHQLSFAQKAIFGLARPDGTFYEIYFRSAPQNSGNITSGFGISYGLRL